jgi:FAM192A/Fyv6, N-terminal domain
MSLSFVSSTVQTSTADGGYEETPIENKEKDEVNRRNAHKPLFEQLRSNQEEEQMKRDEFQREIMRGTCALDADDVAHLSAIQQQRTERESEIQQKTQEELAQFRAMKALRKQAAINESNDLDDVIVDETDGADHRGLGYSGPTTGRVHGENDAVAVAPAPPLGVPIKVKKRKRRTTTIDASTSDNGSGKAKTSKESTMPSKATEVTATKSNKAKPTTTEKDGNNLNSLLAGYGSSSDEE